MKDVLRKSPGYADMHVALAADAWSTGNYITALKVCSSAILKGSLESMYCMYRNGDLLVKTSTLDAKHMKTHHGFPPSGDGRRPCRIN
jgi:hypothetical protein